MTCADAQEPDASPSASLEEKSSLRKVLNISRDVGNIPDTATPQAHTRACKHANSFVG
jgi:hypothetical protein